MKTRIRVMGRSVTVACCTALCLLPPAYSAPQTNAAKPAPAKSTTPEVPRSAFVTPRNAQDGRDPFYPDSNRPYGSNAVPVANTSTNRSLVFVLNGLSGTEQVPLAIVNNYTLSAGEEADIATATGRVRVRCVQIRAKEGAVTIEVGGERRELHIDAGK